MKVVLNENGTLADGLDQVDREYLRHLLRQIGEIVGAQTLPETVLQMALLGLDDPAPQVSELRKEVEQLRLRIEDMSQMAEMAKRIDQLQQQMEGIHSSAADVSELRKHTDALAIHDAFPEQLTDWEHPGKIGFRTPNTGSFTYLNAGVGPIPGTALLPSFYLAEDVRTGFYRAALNNWAFSVDGVRLLDLSTERLQVIGRVGIAAGTVALPSFYMSTDTSTGWYRIAANRWGFSVAGTKLVDMSALAFDVTGVIQNSGAFSLFNGLFKSSGSALQFKGASTAANAEAFIENTDGAFILHASSSSGVAKTVDICASGGSSPQLQVTTAGAVVSGTLSVAGTFGANGAGPQPPYGLPGAATDPATTMSLVNHIRLALLNNGIG